MSVLRSSTPACKRALCWPVRGTSHSFYHAACSGKRWGQCRRALLRVSGRPRARCSRSHSSREQQQKKKRMARRKTSPPAPKCPRPSPCTHTTPGGGHTTNSGKDETGGPQDAPRKRCASSQRERQTRPRMFDFFDLVSCTARTPHGACVRRSEQTPT